MLVDKTDGDQGAKVKSVEVGDGVHAYFKIYWWFVKTSGIAVQDRLRKVMYPEPISKEDKMNESIEAWESDMEILEQ